MAAGTESPRTMSCRMSLSLLGGADSTTRRSGGRGALSIPGREEPLLPLPTIATVAGVVGRTGGLPLHRRSAGGRLRPPGKARGTAAVAGAAGRGRTTRRSPKPQLSRASPRSQPGGGLSCWTRRRRFETLHEGGWEIGPHMRTTTDWMMPSAARPLTERGQDGGATRSLRGGGELIPCPPCGLLASATETAGAPARSVLPGVMM